ncbi:GNAT family N-acetyltransferase [Microbacterium lacticum]
MANDDAVSEPTSNFSYGASVLGVRDAGEILTLQRAAYVTEAQAHRDFDLPALTESIEELCEELRSSAIVALGVRDGTRLIGAVRLRRAGSAIELGRLTVVPDRQGQGIGSFLLHEAETVFPDVDEMRLFTGEHSTANIRLYERNGYVESTRTSLGDYSLVHFTKALS